MGVTMEAPRALHASMLEAGKAIGAIGKNLRNEQSGYSARSIDDILDAVHTPLLEAGIVLVPRVMHRETDTRTSRNGGAIYYVALQVEFEFLGEDGESVTAIAWGEAMDSSDKAGNKAMSAALKMALIQTFTIPVTGEDADAHTPEAEAPRGTLMPPSAMRALSDRVSMYWRHFGRTVYPDAWKNDSSLRPLPYYRDNGITGDEYERVMQIIDDALATIEGGGLAGPASSEPSSSASTPEATPEIPEQCECGTSDLAHHAPGCTWEPM